jgi:hypothetical protein
MSGLLMAPQQVISAALAAFATSFLVSRKHTVTLGTISGMQMLSCEDECLASTPINWQLFCFTRLQR